MTAYEKTDSLKSGEDSEKPGERRNIHILFTVILNMSAREIFMTNRNLKSKML